MCTATRKGVTHSQGRNETKYIYKYIYRDKATTKAMTAQMDTNETTTTTAPPTGTDGVDVVAPPGAAVQTDEKKQHFDDIYFMDNPVPYKVRILDALEYISDDFNRQMFDTHILPWIQQRQQHEGQQQRQPIQFFDLCSCFGNTTMAVVHGMTYNEICTNWADDTSCQTINRPRRFDCTVTAVDISNPAITYGTNVGLYDTGIVCNLNHRTTDTFQQTLYAISQSNVCISTAALVYLDLDTIDALVSAFALGKSSSSNNNDDDDDDDGYMMVNFLNPFALDKADETKRTLLKYLDFVGSRATRHRRMSPLEQRNYPGEEWSLLELWVLKRRTTK